jgi:3-isopropylmalate dehydrogenase
VTKEHTIAVLPGDGIGPEVTAEAVRVLMAVGERFGLRFALPEYSIGAAAVEAAGDPLPPETRKGVLQADAVLLGAVGEPTSPPSGGTGERAASRHLKPETGLLALRALLGVYANLRPVMTHSELAAQSPLKADRLRGVDLIIVRELVGGLYYGEPRGWADGVAVNTLRYSAPEIERVARVAFKLARVRQRRVLSVDKANVLETSQLWRETVTRVGQDYPDVTLEHGHVDVAALRLVSEPAAIDVLLTENMFGDILSDEAAALVGSLGMLPSASLGNGPGLFEPVHGSAPGIAGQGVANPIGAIASAAMLLGYGLGLKEPARAIDQAIAAALKAGCRTRDIGGSKDRSLSTREVGTWIAERVRTGVHGRSQVVAGGQRRLAP